MTATDLHQPMLGFLSWKLIHLIESHSDELADGLWNRVTNSPRLREFCDKVPRDELRARAYEIYRHLGEWLQAKSESDVERSFVAVGKRRASQGIPLSQFILAILATKEHLWEHVTCEALTDHALDLFQVLELSRSVEMFFDRAVYFATLGYEHHQAEHHHAASHHAASAKG